MIYVYEKDGTIYAKAYDGEDCEKLGFTRANFGEDLYIYDNPNKVIPNFFKRYEEDKVLKFSSFMFDACYRSERNFNPKTIEIEDNLIPRFYADSKALDLNEIEKLQIEYHFAAKSKDKARTMELMTRYLEICDERRKAYREEYNKQHPICDLYDLPCWICGDKDTCTARNKDLGYT